MKSSFWPKVPFLDPGYVEMVEELISSVPLIGFWQELEAIP